LMAFMVVCAGVIYLRRKRPDLPRSFRSPFVPLFPILGILFAAFLAIFGLSSLTWKEFGIALIVGLIFFFSYGFWKSDPARVVPVLEPEGTDFV
nr:amino acid permease [Candidatus Eremiobacteraeota bacterium]